MKKIFFVLFAILAVSCVFADQASNEYQANRNNTWNNVTVSPNFYFIVASVGEKEIAEAEDSQEIYDYLQLKAQADVQKVRFNDIVFDGVSAQWSKTLQWGFFLDYINCYPQKYTLKNTFPIEKKISKNKAIYVLAVNKKSSIVWETVFPQKFSEMVNQLALKPGMRNELLFYESLPDQELRNKSNQIFSELQKRYGENVACVLLKKKSIHVDKNTYLSCKNKVPADLKSISLEDLLKLFNTLVDVGDIQSEIIYRFNRLGMKRCALMFEQHKNSGYILNFSSPNQTFTPPASQETKENPPSREASFGGANTKAAGVTSLPQTAPSRNVDFTPVRQWTDQEKENASDVISQELNIKKTTTPSWFKK